MSSNRARRAREAEEAFRREQAEEAERAAAARAERANRSRQAREEYLRETFRVCEERLRRLRKPPDAWRRIEIEWDGTPRPVQVKNMGELSAELGEEYRVIRKRKKVAPDTPSHRRLHRLAQQLAETGGMSYGEALAVIIERNPKLHERYEREIAATLGEVRQAPAYRHTEYAALMRAALARSDDPEAMFAAGLAVGEYHQFDHQERRKRDAVESLKAHMRSLQGQVRKANDTARKQQVAGRVTAEQRDAANEPLRAFLSAHPALSGRAARRYLLNNPAVRERYRIERVPSASTINRQRRKSARRPQRALHIGALASE
jgi:hypothetical protein